MSGDPILKRHPKNWDIPGGWSDVHGRVVDRLFPRWRVSFLLAMFACLIIMGGLGYLVGWRVRDLEARNEMLERCIDD